MFDLHVHTMAGFVHHGLVSFNHSLHWLPFFLCTLLNGRSNGRCFAPQPVHVLLLLTC